MAATRLLEKPELARIVAHLAAQIAERHGQCEAVLLVGIERRGADLARRLAGMLSARLGRSLPLGTLDINLYRDDWTRLDGKPRIGPSHIPADIEGRDVILVDDVLFTGRTIRAALEALRDYGRPRRVELLALIDRGHRELPIQADYVGRIVPTANDEHVDVLLAERDGQDAVVLSGQGA